MTEEKTIGYILNEERKRQGMTVETLAERSGIVEPTVKNILSNRTKLPRRDTLEPLAEALGIPIDKLLNSTKDDDTDMNMQIELCTQQMNEMREAHQKHLENVREHYERHLKDLKESHEKTEQHYEKRLEEKREVIAELEKHIATIMLDKKWFRIGFIIVLSIFVAALGGLTVAELMHPEHGWLRY